MKVVEADGGGSKELCTLDDGRTIVAVFSQLADVQPDSVQSSIKLLTQRQLDAIAAEVKSKCPHIRLINSTVVEKIAARYSITDEIKLLRVADATALAEYNAYVEECRAWGAAEKAKLGF